MPQDECQAKIRVLLVDDHAIVRDAIRRLLEREPSLKIVAQATDGLEAVDQATRVQPDVIVMDVGMPRLNGIEATRRIKRQHPRIRIIGLSMYETADVGATMRQAGADEYLSKSCPPQDLLAAIQNCAAV